MKKILLTISLIALQFFQGNAQQFARFDNSWNIFARTNPAQTNSLDSLEVNLIGRTQWSGINGAPNVFYANLNQICAKVHGSFGFSSEYNKIGFNRTFNFKGNYTFRLPTRIGLFTFGTNIGMSSFRFNTTWIPPQTIADNLLPPTKFKQHNLVFDLGIAYKFNNLRLGLSVIQLSNFLKKPSPIYFDYKPNFSFEAAYNLKLNEKWGSAIYFQSLFISGRFINDLAYVVNYKKRFEFGAIFNNIFYVDSWIYGLSLGYNHKSGIGIYASGSISKPNYPLFPNPTFEIGLKYRRN